MPSCNARSNAPRTRRDSTPSSRLAPSVRWSRPRTAAAPLRPCSRSSSCSSAMSRTCCMSSTLLLLPKTGFLASIDTPPFQTSTPARPQTPAPLSTGLRLVDQWGGLFDFAVFPGCDLFTTMARFAPCGRNVPLRQSVHFLRPVGGIYPCFSYETTTHDKLSPKSFLCTPQLTSRKGLSKPRAYRGAHMSTPSSSYAGRPGCPHSFGTAANR